LTAFELFIGIDYSGAQTPDSRLKALQVYAAAPGKEPKRIDTPAIARARDTVRSAQSLPRYWSRKDIAAYLIDLAKAGTRYVAGLDHGFSFPESYFRRYGIASWQAFLDDFCHHWPTDQDHVYVDFIRDGALMRSHGWPPPDARVGTTKDFRLCEHWTSSAKSVFQFDMQGSVAKSTHAGIPWLKRIRDAVGDRVHFWPFDGWQPSEGKAVIAEVYPSIFRNRYEKNGRTGDQQDACAVARWLAESAARGVLDRYWNPPLTIEERRTAALEGWILGIT
jgi:hypothetical protein